MQATSNNSNRVLRLYQRFKQLPFGMALFARFCARQAPYFKTIKPQFIVLEPNHCEIVVRKRRAVENHIGTLHVIAILNGLEFAMGFMAEASIPAHLRWIPKGMQVDYVGKAGSNIRCVAKADPAAWRTGNLEVAVDAYDENQEKVVSGTILLWISEKPAKAN